MSELNSPFSLSFWVSGNLSEQGQQTFFMTAQRVNILGSAGHTVFVTTTVTATRKQPCIMSSSMLRHNFIYGHQNLNFM